MVKVGILRGEKPDIRRLLELIEFAPGKREVAVVKANLCVSYPGLQGSPMDLRVLSQLLEYLEGITEERLVVDSCPTGGSVSAVYESTGAMDVCSYYGAEVVDLNKDVHIPVKRDLKVLKHVRVPRSILKADVFIDLALMKTSELVGVSLALKNLLDILPGSSTYYSERMDEAICDALRIRKPDLGIIDGMVAVERNQPRRMNLVLASTDPVALDVVGCKVMGINPGMVEYLVKAGFYNLGETLLQKIEVVGERIEKVRERFMY
jgi:uncharacterized protein (DUF362 family)